MLSNFGHVVAADPDIRLLVRLPGLFAVSELRPVQRGPRWTIDLPPEVALIETGRPRPVCACDHDYRHAVTSQPVRIRAVEAKFKVWDNDSRAARPAREVYYPLDRDTLPSGVKSQDLVTVGHAVHGEVVGGVTYSIGPARKPRRR